MEGLVERIWITDVATDGIHLVGHNKGYIQVLVNGSDSLLGASATVRITSVGRWSVFGEVIEVLSCSAQETTLDKKESSLNGFSPCGASNEPCACSEEPDSCCSAVPCTDSLKPSVASVYGKPGEKDQNVDGLRKRNSPIIHGSENTVVQQPKLTDESEKTRTSTAQFNFVDKSLIAGIILSFLIAVVSLSQLWLRKVMSS